ncbi:MAG: rhomboid family intramembrane serine protease [Succinimonas sp.]|jgi:membrane associated rhomboid family serine protease|nr:rhomboid family intramembrane serine protease [Succinimonas sp.]
MKGQAINIIVFALIAAASLGCSYYHPTLWSLSPWDITHQHWYWEFITGNFVHFDLHHLAENLAGFFIIWFFFFAESCATWAHRLISFAVSGLCVTLGIFFFTNTSEYGGMSGALHGMVTAAGLARLLIELDWKGGVILAAVAAKIYIDFNHPEFGFDEITRNMYGDNFHFTSLNQQVKEVSNYRVSAPSHLYGAIAGLVTGFLFFIHNKRG